MSTRQNILLQGINTVIFGFVWIIFKYMRLNDTRLFDLVAQTQEKKFFSSLISVLQDK